MTREEAIEHFVEQLDIFGGEHAEAMRVAIEALRTETVRRVDCSNFLLWLLEEIMDEDNWELNAVADGEIIARKLKKLGLLEVKDGYYHRIFDENVWVVRCKDCRWWSCTDSLYQHNSHLCRYWKSTNTSAEDFCSYGERQCNYFGERREPTIPMFKEAEDAYKAWTGEDIGCKSFTADEWYRQNFKDGEAE